MNVQQLNHSGQNIEVFLITAAAALSLTFFIWSILAQGIRHLQWYRQMQTFLKSDRSSDQWQNMENGYSLTTRLYILFSFLRRNRSRVRGHEIKILMNRKTYGNYICDEMSREYIENVPVRPIEDDFQNLSDYL